VTGVDHRLILASAGTGKTFQLTNRFIALLARGEAPCAILASTFTRKAAGEILQRVLGSLAAAVDDPAELDLVRRFADERLTAERCASLVAELIEALPRLSVLTIDAFFARAARCFALELGVPGALNMAEDHADEEMRAEAMARAIEAEDLDELADQIMMLHRESAGRSVHETLLRAVDEAYEAFVETRDNAEAWARLEPASAPLGEPALAEAMERLRRLELPRTGAGEIDQRWQRAHDDALDRIARERWEELLTRGLAAKVLAREGYFHSKPIDEAVTRAYQPIIDHGGAVLLRRFAARVRATREMMERFDDAYASLKRTEGAYRFDDVPRLLRRAEALGSADLLYYRLDARLRHALLDEFQDTSRVQFELLEPMLDEILAQGEGRSVFIVGDVKQSLYGWRQAEPGLLEHLPDRWPQLEPEAMDESQRSSPVVLGAVNRVFGSLADNEALADEPGAAAWTQRFHEHRPAARKAALPGLARVSVADVPAKASKEEQSRAALELACARVEEIRDGAPRARVAILLRRNRYIAEVIHLLGTRGIGASQEGGAPMTDAAPVAAALSALRLAAHPGETAALFHLGTCPFGERLGIEDPLDADTGRRIASRLRARLVPDGYARALAWLGGACLDRMTTRERERFEQLIRLGSKADAGGLPATRPGEFVRLAESTRLDAPGDDPVRVMTIHASKGLEFDAVVLPELEESIDGRPGTVIIDRSAPTAPVEAVSLHPNELMRSLDPGLAEMHARRRARQVEEQLCGLYVAMTRAVHHLEMIVHPRTNPDAQRGLADVVRGGVAPGALPDPGVELWRDGDEGWMATFAGSAPAAAPPPREAALRLSTARRQRSDRLASRSPSELGGGSRVDLGQLLRPMPAGGAEAGSIMHAWFELIGWLEDGEPSDEALLEAAGAQGYSPERARGLIGAFRRALAHDELRGALSRARYAPEAELTLERERAFAVRIEDPDGAAGAEPVLMTGRFDRLVIEREAGAGSGGRARAAEILDFKTDAIEDESELGPRVEAHRGQMEAYRAAASAMLGIDRDRVRAALVFASAGRVVELNGPGREDGS